MSLKGPIRTGWLHGRGKGPTEGTHQTVLDYLKMNLKRLGKGLLEAPGPHSRALNAREAGRTPSHNKRRIIQSPGNVCFHPLDTKLSPLEEEKKAHSRRDWLGRWEWSDQGQVSGRDTVQRAGNPVPQAVQCLAAAARCLGSNPALPPHCPHNLCLNLNFFCMR